VIAEAPKGQPIPSSEGVPLATVSTGPLEHEAAVGKLTVNTSGVIARATRDVTAKDCSRIITLHPTEGITPGLTAAHAGNRKWAGIWEMDLNAFTKADRVMLAAFYEALPEQVRKTIPMQQFEGLLNRLFRTAKKTYGMPSANQIGKAPAAGSEVRSIKVVIMGDMEKIENLPTNLLKIDPGKLANKKYVRVVGRRRVVFLEKNFALGEMKESAPPTEISAAGIAAEDVEAVKVEPAKAGAHAHGSHAPGKLSIGASILGAALSFAMWCEFDKEARKAGGEEKVDLERRKIASAVIGVACVNEAIFKILEHEPFGKSSMPTKIAGRFTQGFALLGIAGGLLLAGCDYVKYRHARDKGEQSLASAFLYSAGVNLGVALVSATALIPAIILSWATEGMWVYGAAATMGSSPIFFIGVPGLGFVLMIAGVYIAMAVASAESQAKKDHCVAHSCWGRGEHFNSFTLERHQFQAAMA
jgi:hypothetical protein